MANVHPATIGAIEKAIREDNFDTALMLLCAAMNKPAAGEAVAGWAKFTFHDKRVMCEPEIATRVQAALLHEVMAEINARERAAAPVAATVMQGCVDIANSLTRRLK